MGSELDRATYSSRAIERVLKILRCFTVQHPARSYLEVAEETGIPASTVFRIMQILAQEGFLERDSVEGQFRIGIEIFRLGDLFLADRLLVEVARPELAQLAQQAGFTTNLSVRDGYNTVTILVQVGPGRLSLTARLGGVVPVNYTASGKALIMDMSDEELAQLMPPAPWPQRTPNSITTLEKLRAELQRSRERGCTLDEQEGTIGIRCVAAPIRNHRGEIVAAVSISGTIIDMTPETLPKLMEMVKTAGQRISYQLGYRPPYSAAPSPEPASQPLSEARLPS